MNLGSALFRRPCESTAASGRGASSGAETFQHMSPSKSREPGDMKHLSDQELMSIVQAGDYAPASEIYERYSGRIYNFAFRFLKNAEAAEDAVQEVFVKMIRHAHQFHGDAK